MKDGIQQLLVIRTEKDLIDGRCPDTGKEVQWIAEKHYFLNVKAYYPDRGVDSRQPRVYSSYITKK